jgi:hypothetical protein
MNLRAMIACALLSPVLLSAQQIIDTLQSGGGGRLFSGDAAILDVREARTALPCELKPVRAELGFDLAFHAGFEVRVPLGDLAGDGGVLTSIFRVTSVLRPDSPVYFQQKWTLPPIPEDSSGSVALNGAFTLGEGDYQVDWLIRDQLERACSAYWRISARMPGNSGQFTGGPPPGVVLEDSCDGFPVRAVSLPLAGPPLTLNILLNISPQLHGGAMITPAERQAMFSILRGIGRDPRVASISLTAFNLEQSQIIFQQEDARQIDFAKLTDAIDSLKLGTVSVSQLADRELESRFLMQLATKESQQSHVDAVIFVGPRIKAGFGQADDGLKHLREANCPIFYLSYNTAPAPDLWPDLISKVVRRWKGREFTISRPTDLLSAWSKIMSEVGKVNGWGR